MVWRLYENMVAVDTTLYEDMMCVGRALYEDTIGVDTLDTTV